MSQIVNGYTGVIAPPNLIGNGSFNINQRGLFTTATPVELNDYVCDMWKVNANTIDYCTARVFFGNGLWLEGTGKKGQTIVIANRDTSHRGVVITDKEEQSTATLWGSARGCKVYCSPLFRNYQATRTIHSYIEGPDQRCVTTVNQTYDGNDTTLSYFEVELTQDGEFSFYAYEFGEFAGGFKHPPKLSPVPYADDLVRCQRWYQKGTATAFGNWNDGVNDHILQRVNFNSVMASTPTWLISNTVLYENGSIVDLVGNYTPFNWDMNERGVTQGFYKAFGGNRPERLNFEWSAEVV